MTSPESIQRSDENHSGLGSLPLVQKLEAYDILRLIEGPALNRYFNYLKPGPLGKNRGTEGISTRTRQIWTETLQDEIHASPEDFTSLHRLYGNTVQFGGFSVDYGSWEKPGKPYSGDFVKVWKQDDILFGVVADGATMVMQGDELPPVIRQLSTVSGRDRELFVPDHLWASVVYRNFFDGSEAPVAPEIAKRIRKYSYRNNEQIIPADAVVDVWLTTGQETDVVSDLIHQSQKNLFLTYTALFGKEIMSDPAHVNMLPSGVMNVFALHPDGRIDYAYTGDIDLFSVEPDRSAVRVSDEYVSAHDAAARLIGIDDRDFAAHVSVSRVPEVGNLTGLVEVPVRRGSFLIPEKGGVVIQTDGERLNWTLTSVTSARNVPARSPSGKRVDAGASLLFRNPFLYQMDLIREQRRFRKYRKDPFNRNKPISRIYWRADDATYLCIQQG